MGPIVTVINGLSAALIVKNREGYTVNRFLPCALRLLRI